MNLSAPKMITWVVALIVGVVGILLTVAKISILAVPFGGLGFWLVVVAFVLLLVATLMKGL